VGERRGGGRGGVYGKRERWGGGNGTSQKYLKNLIAYPKWLEGTGNKKKLAGRQGTGGKKGRGGKERGVSGRKKVGGEKSGRQGKGFVETLFWSTKNKKKKRRGKRKRRASDPSGQKK